MSADIMNTEALADQVPAHEVRITTHGKMQAWVDFALTFFENNDCRPLTLHTLPCDTNVSLQSEGGDAHGLFVPKEPQPPKQQGSKARSASLVPRLVSIAEIIKREYLKKLDTSLANDNGTLHGLYQYNELGDAASPSDERGAVDVDLGHSLSVSHALAGKNYPKLKRTIPFMKVTLCRVPLPHLAAQRGITCQEPAIRRLTKAAKARRRKGIRRALAHGAMEGRASVV